jgi:hypothetical protein
MMHMHYTNLVTLRLHNACESRYTHLVGALGPEWGDEDKIPLVRILDTNGIDDAIWSLRANLHPEAAKYSRLYACDSAERVAHLNLDPRVQAAIDTGRRYAHGEATDAELSAAAEAARTAGYATTRAAARAARAAGYAAWGDAARATRAYLAAADSAGAAWDAWAAGAAGAAAWAAERDWQEAHFRKMFG